MLGTVPALQPQSPPGPHLMVVEESKSYPRALPATGRLLIGRGTEADLQLSEPAASRRHAEIIVESGEVRVRDLDSLNGTPVNGERLKGERTLLAGDTITIGATALILYLPPAAVPAAAPGRRPHPAPPADRRAGARPPVRLVGQRVHGGGRPAR